MRTAVPSRFFETRKLLDMDLAQALPSGIRRSVPMVRAGDAVAVSGRWTAEMQRWWDGLPLASRPALFYYADPDSVSLEFLTGLEGLWGLSLVENAVADHTVEALTGLTHLVLDQLSTRVFDVSALTNLVRLGARGHTVRGLESLQKLQTIGFGNLKTRTGDLRLLESLPNPLALRTLLITSTNAADVQAMTRFENLEYLKLGSRNHLPLGGIEQLTSLRRIDLWRLPYVDVERWASALPRLRWVYLQWVKELAGVEAFESRPEVLWSWDTSADSKFSLGAAPSWWQDRLWLTDVLSGIPGDR